MEFNIIREEFSPEPERPTKVNIPEISMKNEEDIDMGDEPADEVSFALWLSLCSFIDLMKIKKLSEGDLYWHFIMLFIMS